MLFPCKNSQLGCTANVLLKDKANHDLTCSFRQYECILSTCNWHGFKQELVVHMSNQHRRKVIVGNNQSIKLSLEPNLPNRWVMSVLDEVFTVTFVNADGVIKGYVVYLGDFENARKYTYKFTIRGRNGQRLSWRERTYPDQGQPVSWALFKGGFSYPTSHTIFENRLGRLPLNIPDVAISITKSQAASS